MRCPLKAFYLDFCRLCLISNHLMNGKSFTELEAATLTQFDNSSCFPCSPEVANQIQTRKCQWYVASTQNNSCQREESLTDSEHCAYEELTKPCQTNGKQMKKSILSSAKTGKMFCLTKNIQFCQNETFKVHEKSTKNFCQNLKTMLTSLQ